MTHTVIPPINSKWTVFRRVACTVTLLWLLAPAVFGAGSCDLNSDGQVNVVDVQMGVNQSLGAQTCSSADINVDGQCNVVDVQLLVNVALGDGCPTQLTEGAPFAQPWVTGFTPQRIHYVDDVACGGNGTIGNPECDATAFSTTHYQCGDLHLFRGGNYRVGVVSTALSRNCPESAPAVFKGYVDSNGQPERAKTVGTFALKGSWTWLVGLEMTDQVTTSIRNLLDVKCDGCRVINNVIYESRYTDNLNVWEGSRNVIYGNVLYRPSPLDVDTPHGHNIYTHNDFDTDGWKYYIQNMSLETILSGSKLVNVRAKDGWTTGFHFEKNLFADARTSIAITHQGSGDHAVVHTIEWHNNYHIDHAPSGSQRSLDIRPSVPKQVQITDSYFAKASFSHNAYWAASGGPQPSIFSGNEDYDPAGRGAESCTRR